MSADEGKGLHSKLPLELGVKLLVFVLPSLPPPPRIQVHAMLKLLRLRARLAPCRRRGPGSGVGGVGGVSVRVPLSVTPHSAVPGLRSSQSAFLAASPATFSTVSAGGFGGGGSGRVLRWALPVAAVGACGAAVLYATADTDGKQSPVASAAALLRMMVAHGKAFGGVDAVVVRCVAGLCTTPEHRALFRRHGGLHALLHGLDSDQPCRDLDGEVAALLAVLCSDGPDAQDWVMNALHAHHWARLLAAGQPAFTSVAASWAVKAADAAARAATAADGEPELSVSSAALHGAEAGAPDDARSSGALAAADFQVPDGLTSARAATQLFTTALAADDANAVAFAGWVLSCALHTQPLDSLQKALRFLDANAVCELVVGAVHRTADGAGPHAHDVPLLSLLPALLDARVRHAAVQANVHTASDPKWVTACDRLLQRADVTNALLSLAMASVPRCQSGSDGGSDHGGGGGGTCGTRAPFTTAAGLAAVHTLTALAALPTGRCLLTDDAHFPHVVALIRRCNSWPELAPLILDDSAAAAAAAAAAADSSRQQLPLAVVLATAELAAALALPGVSGDVSHLDVECPVVDGLDDATQALREEVEAEKWARFWPEAPSAYTPQSTTERQAVCSPVATMTEFAFRLLAAGGATQSHPHASRCTQTALSLLENLAVHSNQRGIVLQDWLLHTLQAAVRHEPVAVQETVGSQLAQNMSNIAQRAVRSIELWAGSAFVPVRFVASRRVFGAVYAGGYVPMFTLLFCSRVLSSPWRPGWKSRSFKSTASRRWRTLRRCPAHTQPCAPTSVGRWWW